MKRLFLVLLLVALAPCIYLWILPTDPEIDVMVEVDKDDVLLTITGKRINYFMTVEVDSVTHAEPIWRIGCHSQVIPYGVDTITQKVRFGVIPEKAKQLYPKGEETPRAIRHGELSGAHSGRKVFTFFKDSKGQIGAM